MPQGAELLPNGLPDPTLPQPREIRVVEAVGSSTVFSLTFDFAIQEGDLPLLAEPRLGPQSEIAVRVPDGDASAVLVRGPVTRQRISLVTGGEGSAVEVQGADATVTLGREHKVHVWAATTDAAAILKVLTDAGWTPVVDLPGGVVHSDMKNSLVQRESDLQLVRRLAGRNGCWFWLSYEPMTALPMAHVARPPVDGVPDVHFHLNGAQRNIDTATVEWDAERVVTAQAEHREAFGATDLNGGVDRSPLQGLADNALADIVAEPVSAQISMPVDDAGDLLARSEAALIDDGWFVKVQLQARARVLHRVVRAHTVAELHGAGSRHSGKYLVSKVAHRIDDAEHWMDVTLVRNGWNGA
jgi:phage protein D